MLGGEPLAYHPLAALRTPQVELLAFAVRNPLAGRKKCTPIGKALTLDELNYEL